MLSMASKIRDDTDGWHTFTALLSVSYGKHRYSITGRNIVQPAQEISVRGTVALKAWSNQSVSFGHLTVSTASSAMSSKTETFRVSAAVFKNEVKLRSFQKLPRPYLDMTRWACATRCCPSGFILLQTYLSLWVLKWIKTSSRSLFLHIWAHFTQFNRFVLTVTKFGLSELLKLVKKKKKKTAL